VGFFGVRIVGWGELLDMAKRYKTKGKIPATLLLFFTGDLSLLTNCFSGASRSTISFLLSRSIFLQEVCTLQFTNQEAAHTSGEPISFSFGRNWERYIEASLSEVAIQHAQGSFVTFTKLADLRDHTFLDIGCGSGLSSLIAYRLGAKKIVSVDVDPHSVNSTKKVWEQFAAKDRRWEVRQGSVLDPKFCNSLGQFSYVYSWGVLHHTGAMWHAINNVLPCVEKGGMLHIALYNEYKNAAKWLKIKRICNKYPRSVFPLLKASYGAYACARLLAQFRSPLEYIHQYRENRGMNFWRDIEDRLGGLPYEYCKPDQIVDFCSDHNFVLLRLSTSQSFGCNEFLFKSFLPPQVK
jgi:2-polyprenyl-6-hydroxyphenyl methylase/3-demethylubiquinone-9 3-methyltransferase